MAVGTNSINTNAEFTLATVIDWRPPRSGALDFFARDPLWVLAVMFGGALWQCGCWQRWRRLLIGMPSMPFCRTRPDTRFAAAAGAADRCFRSWCAGAAVSRNFGAELLAQRMERERARRAVRQPAGQEHDLPQPAAGGRHHGARDQ
jgi:hypothetical protein